MLIIIKHDNFADEIHADEFASNVLIRKESFNEFMSKPITAFSIKELARKEGVTDSIVVGRLCHQDKSYYPKFEYLREKYEWAESI